MCVYSAYRTEQEWHINLEIALNSHLHNPHSQMQAAHSAENRVFYHNIHCSLKLSTADAKVLNRGT
jgi:hypothetical protein